MEEINKDFQEKLEQQRLSIKRKGTAKDVRNHHFREKTKTIFILNNVSCLTILFHA
jgi:hypothetical protein